MASKIEKKEHSIVEMILELTAEDFAKAMQEAYRHQAKRFTVPGFRKGKAPYQLAMRHYGEAVLYDDAIDIALNPAYREALEEHGVDPVARPSMDILEIGSEVGLKVRLEITVKPEVKLGAYEGVEAYCPSKEVSEDEVDAELKRVQDRSGRMVPVEDRAAQKDDTAKIDFEGFVDGEAFEGGKGEGYDLVLGSGQFIPGFEDQIIGHMPGDHFDVEVTFPEQYAAQELAGKAATFKTTLHSLKKKELPELDDEFAKDVSEFDTLDEYKASLRKKLEEAAEHRAKHVFEDHVVEAVVDQAEVEIPEVMIEQEIDEMLYRQQQSMSYQGIELNQYLQYLGKTLEEYRKDFREAAYRNAKTALVIEAVSEVLHPEVSEEDRKNEYEKMAQQYGMKVEDLEKRFAGESKMIDNMIISRKTVEHMVDHAKPTDVDPHDHGHDHDHDHDHH